MLLTGAAMSQTRLNIIQLRESWTGMGISETIQYTDACHAILFQQFNCAAAFGNPAVVRTISNPHHDVVRISTSFKKHSSPKGWLVPVLVFGDLEKCKIAVANLKL